MTRRAWLQIAGITVLLLALMLLAITEMDFIYAEF